MSRLTTSWEQSQRRTAFDSGSARRTIRNNYQHLRLVTQTVAHCDLYQVQPSNIGHYRKVTQ